MQKEPLCLLFYQYSVDLAQARKGVYEVNPKFTPKL
jgi:hypothetical protein